MWEPCTAAVSVNTRRTSPSASPIITGMRGLIMPAFSDAISGRVSPSSAVWSLEILVMIDSSGVMMLVLSSRPPSPTSITAISTL